MPAAAVVVGEPAEREIVVDTATTEATLTNRGGRILHWRLKEYRDSQGEPLDLVPSALPARSADAVLAARGRRRRLTQQLNTAIYQVTGDAAGRVDARTAEGTLVFEFQDARRCARGRNFASTRRTTWSRSPRRSRATAQPLNPSVVWGPGLGDIGARAGGGSFFTGNYVQPPQGIYHRDGDVERVAGDDLVEQPVHEGVVSIRGDRRSLLPRGGLESRAGPRRVSADSLAGPDETQRQAALRRPHLSAAARRTSASSTARSSSIC